MQFAQRCYGHPRVTEFHPCTHDRIEHPARYYPDYASTRFNMGNAIATDRKRLNRITYLHQYARGAAGGSVRALEAGEISKAAAPEAGAVNCENDGKGARRAPFPRAVKISG